MPKIKSIEFKGYQQTHDLEVEHPDHQFYLSNGVLTSNSHAISYAIDSYYAAWLYTYYPKHWIATSLQSSTGKPDELEKVIKEVKVLGYRIGEIDINYSGFEWVFSEERNAFIPPLGSIKRVGETAVEEILNNRPYKDIKSLLYDSEGKWYHSKLNKGAFDSLCKVEAFNSLDEFKSGRLKNHRQLYEIVIENYNILKKGPSGLTKSQIKKLQKENKPVPDLVENLIDQCSNIDDWSRIDKIETSMDLKSEIDNKLLFPSDLIKRVEKIGIKPITQLRGGETEVCWFIILAVEKKKTKNGKDFLKIKAGDHENGFVWLKVWGSVKKEIEPYTIWMAESQGDDQWGPSTGIWKMRMIINREGEYEN